MINITLREKGIVCKTTRKGTIRAFSTSRWESFPLPSGQYPGGEYKVLPEFVGIQFTVDDELIVNNRLCKIRHTYDHYISIEIIDDPKVRIPPDKGIVMADEIVNEFCQSGGTDLRMLFQNYYSKHPGSWYSSFHDRFWSRVNELGIKATNRNCDDCKQHFKCFTTKCKKDIQ